MSKLVWDQSGKRLYETGVDHGVLYPIQTGGVYSKGVAWNGLTAVTESACAPPAAPSATSRDRPSRRAADAKGGRFMALRGWAAAAAARKVSVLG